MTLDIICQISEIRILNLKKTSTSLTKSQNFRPDLYQLTPEYCARPRSQICAVVPHRLIGQLIDIHIQIPISRNARTVRPDDPGVSDERMGL